MILVAALFLLMNVAGLVGYNLLLRRHIVVTKINPWVLASLIQTGVTLPAIPLMLVIHPELHRFTALSLTLTLLVGVLLAVLQFATVKALQRIGAGTNAVLYSARIVVTTFLAALLLHEWPSLWQAIGGLFILMAIIILRQKGNQRLTREGIMWGLGAAVAASLVNVIEKYLINDVGVFTSGPVVLIAATLLLWCIVLNRQYPMPTMKQVMTKQMIALVVFRLCVSWGFALALATGALVAVATYISSLSVVAIAILGVFLLDERDYLYRKTGAVILAVIGLTGLVFG